MFRQERPPTIRRLVALPGGRGSPETTAQQDVLAFPGLAKQRELSILSLVPTERIGQAGQPQAGGNGDSLSGPPDFVSQDVQARFLGAEEQVEEPEALRRGEVVDFLGAAVGTADAKPVHPLKPDLGLNQDGFGLSRVMIPRRG